MTDNCVINTAMCWKKAFVYFILMFCRFFFLSLCVSQFLFFFFHSLRWYVNALCENMSIFIVFTSVSGKYSTIWSHHMQSKYFMNYVEKWKVFFHFGQTKKVNSHWNRHFKRPIHGWNIIAYVENTKKLIFSSGNRNRINISVKIK